MKKYCPSLTSIVYALAYKININLPLGRFKVIIGLVAGPND